MYLLQRFNVICHAQSKKDAFSSTLIASDDEVEMVNHICFAKCYNTSHYVMTTHILSWTNIANIRTIVCRAYVTCFTHACLLELL